MQPRVSGKHPINWGRKRGRMLRMKIQTKNCSHGAKKGRERDKADRQKERQTQRERETQREGRRERGKEGDTGRQTEAEMSTFWKFVSATLRMRVRQPMTAKMSVTVVINALCCYQIMKTKHLQRTERKWIEINLIESGRGTLFHAIAWKSKIVISIAMNVGPWYYLYERRNIYHCV